MADSPIIAEAVLVVASSRHDKPLAQRMEAAMRAAVQACLDHGVPISDRETITAAMRAARRRVLDGDDT